MMNTLRRHPLHVLLVEDHEDVRRDCLDRLRRKFSHIKIDEAGSRDEALDWLNKAREAKSPYDYAILDLSLPDSCGGLEKRDKSLALDVIRLFGGKATRMLQWTAYPEAKAIEHVRIDPEIAKKGGVYEVISKRDVNWVRKMEDFLLRGLAERHIGERLDEPQLAVMRDRESVAMCNGRLGAGATSFNFLAFIRALMDAWRYLEPFRQREALETFAGTEWELIGEGDRVALRHERTRAALEDAEETAHVMAEMLEGASQPASSEQRRS